MPTVIALVKNPGRPPEKVPHRIAQALLDWLCQGRPLRAFCSQSGNPSIRTVYDWRAKDDSFRSAFQAAREFGWDTLFGEVLEIADEEMPKGCDARCEVARRRLKINARLWLMARWFPNRAGR